MFRAQDVAEATAAAHVTGAPDVGFHRVCLDSRQVQPGDLFVALRGQRADGHDFVGEALRRGAAGALVERLPEGAAWGSAGSTGQPVLLVPDTTRALGELAHSWRQKHAVRVVGVTGSVGKTTTKETIAHLLSHRFSVLRSAANQNTELGLPLSLMELGPGHEVAVLEMGMLALGEIEQLAAMAEPEVGVVTNVAPIHLERLGTIDRIARAKGELVQALPPDGLAVLNGDDERVRVMGKDSPAPTCLFGTSRESDVWASEIHSLGLRGTEALMHWGIEEARVRLRLLGDYSIYAALAGLAVALHFGMEFPEAVDLLAAVPPGPRLAVLPGVGGSTLLDDTYNASPPSTLAALEFLDRLGGRKIAILGDMLELGSFEEEGHRQVGQKAAQVADGLFTVGDRARLIAAEALAQGMNEQAVQSFATAAEVIRRLRPELRSGDHVLVKGSRAMHLEEIVDALRLAAQTV